ncbi:flagellum-specific ATP synthase [Paracoccus isoporae]|uniref:Flagellum-specific ATP synthase n=1 Tax=Paracoccus isoporae TaxID=591205 RepID=A0A1G7CWW1_9RHOB|nr:FliI/YscN family ATPase [Paracoccus isoporae]SDE43777.1 flagellum-specific ATP synthase [Paracoccus isoporae]
MNPDKLESIAGRIRRLRATRHFGSVTEINAGLVRITGLHAVAAIGDRVRLGTAPGICGEIISLGPGSARVLPEEPANGLSIGMEAEFLGPPRLYPGPDWVGRVLDPLGRPLDGRPLPPGPRERGFTGPPPAAVTRRPLGPRLATGLAVFDTLLPLVRGQRIGLFAGSGVGKSRLLSDLATGVAADVSVIALIGERGRELREFVEQTLGPEGMARAVIIAGTSDQSPLIRRRCAWAAMAVAEFFRDRGQHVLLLADSVTRFAEAHREIALSAGEAASDRGFPPSTAHLIMSLAERAGPGAQGAGDITAIFSVLVAGSDMEEPVADILRGVLDGHVVLERAIAERGRFPAIDVLRSVSRALPRAASERENALIGRARGLLGAYAESELMVKSGLYAAGSDPFLDEAVRLYPALDRFIAQSGAGDCAASFTALSDILDSRSAGIGKS